MAQDQQLSQLHAAFGSTAAGSARLLLVQGEPGLGKSWLVGRFRQELDSFAPLVGNPPFLASLLRSAHPILHQDHDPELLAAVARLRPGEPWRQRPLPPASGQSDLPAALPVADALGRAAHRQGRLAIVLEDLHTWGAQDRQELLTFWLRLLANRAPVMLLLTTRHVDLEEWNRLRHDTLAFGGAVPEILSREPLAATGQIELSSAFLQHLGYPRELDEWLAERAQGHPLHQLELLRFLLQGGSLLRSTGTWLFKAPGDNLLPASLAQLLTVRVSTLEPGPLRDVVQLVALAERPMVVTELGRMLELDRLLLDELLQQAGTAGLLQVQLENGATSVRLNHPLLGPAIRRDTSVMDTARLRRSLVDHTGRLAERARHARLLEHRHAVMWTMEALQAALASGSNAEILEAGQALLDSAGLHERDQLLEQAALASQRLGNPQRALDFASRGQSLGLLKLRCELLANFSEFEEALEVSRRICREFPQQNLTSIRTDQVHLLLQLGLLQDSARLAAKLLADSRLSSVERAGLLVRQAMSTKYLRGYQAAFDQCAQAVTLLRTEAPHSRQLLVALANQIGLGALSGEWAASAAAAAEATQLCERLVLPQYLPSLNSNRAFLLWISGQYAEAEKVLQDCLRLSQEQANDYVKGISLWNYGRWQLATGQVAEAVATLRSSLELGGASGPDLAEALALAGELEEAVVQLDGVINEANCYSHPQSKAVVWLCSGEPGRALAELDDADPYAAHPAHAARHELLRALSHHALGHAGRAAHVLSEAFRHLEAGPHEPLRAELQVAACLLGTETTATALAAAERLRQLGATGHMNLLHRLFPGQLQELLQELESDRKLTATPESPVFIQTFSGLQLPHAAWKARQARELLSLLLLRRLGGEFRTTRTELLRQLWPDSEPKQAATNLRVTLQRLRRALGTPAAIMRNDQDELELQGVVTDAELFAQSAGDGDWVPALGWYSGEFLPESGQQDASLLREHYRELFRRCLLELARTGPPEVAITQLERALALEPLDLDVLKALIELLRNSPARRSRVLKSSSEAFRNEFGEVPTWLQELA